MLISKREVALREENARLGAQLAEAQAQLEKYRAEEEVRAKAERAYAAQFDAMMSYTGMAPPQPPEGT